MILKTNQIAEMVAFETAPVLLNEDYATMQSIFEAVKPSREFHRLQVMRLDSSIFFDHADTLRFGNKQAFNQFYSVQKPLIADGREVGLLRLSYSLALVNRKVRTARLHMGLLCLVIFVFGAVAVILITRYFSRPFNVMLTTVERIASGDSSARANIRSDDEIGFLAREFDIMLDRLMTAYKHLDDLNQDLELQIESRTAALRLSNAQLKSELKERKKAEKDLSAERFRLMATLSKIDEGVITTDIHNNITVMNRVAAEITGCNEVDATGKQIGDVFKLPVSADDGQNVHDIHEFIQQLDSEENSSVITIVDSKSREKQLNISVIPIHTLFGEKTGTVFIFQPRHVPPGRKKSDLKKYQA